MRLLHLSNYNYLIKVNEGKDLFLGQKYGLIVRKFIYFGAKDILNVAFVNFTVPCTELMITIIVFPAHHVPNVLDHDFFSHPDKV